MILSKKRITKALIRLPGCPGWSAPVLFANHRREVFLRRGQNRKEKKCKGCSTLYCKLTHHMFCRILLEGKHHNISQVGRVLYNIRISSLKCFAKILQQVNALKGCKISNCQWKFTYTGKQEYKGSNQLSCTPDWDFRCFYPWDNSISHTMYQPMGKIKMEQPHIRGQVTSLSCQSNVILLCHISVPSWTSGVIF